MMHCIFPNSSGGLEGCLFILKGFSYGRSSSWRDCGISVYLPGFADKESHSFVLHLLLAVWIHHWNPLHLVDFTLLMHISLSRACQCDCQDACIFTLPVCGRVQAVVFAYLSRPEARRVLISCILLLSDQKDILLGRTEVQLALCLSTYSVPTPPVAFYLLPVVHGQGGVWDLDTVSADSSSSSEGHAVEEEDVEAVPAW